MNSRLFFGFGNLPDAAKLDYLKLKKRVFFDEYAWNLELDPSGEMVRWDEFDTNSLFSFASTSSGEICGVVRATSCEAEYPHRNFVNTVLPAAWHPGRTAILTSFMVRKDLRKKQVPFGPTVTKDTLGSHVLSNCLHFLKILSFEGAVLTTESGSLENYMRNHGFLSSGHRVQIEDRAAWYIHMIHKF